MSNAITKSISGVQGYEELRFLYKQLNEVYESSLSTETKMILVKALLKSLNRSKNINIQPSPMSSFVSKKDYLEGVRLKISNELFKYED